MADDRALPVREPPEAVEFLDDAAVEKPAEG